MVILLSVRRIFCDPFPCAQLTCKRRRTGSNLRRRCSCCSRRSRPGVPTGPCSASDDSPGVGAKIWRHSNSCRIRRTYIQTVSYFCVSSCGHFYNYNNARLARTYCVQKFRKVIFFNVNKYLDQNYRCGFFSIMHF